MTPAHADGLVECPVCDEGISDREAWFCSLCNGTGKVAPEDAGAAMVLGTGGDLPDGLDTRQRLQHLFLRNEQGDRAFWPIVERWGA